MRDRVAVRPVARREEAIREPRMTSELGANQRFTIEGIRERAPHAHVAQRGLVQVEPEVVRANTGRAADRETRILLEQG
jgi:hypothetical protein